jgi:hypothetical protein
VPALERAVPFAEDLHVAELVTDHLDLDVPAALDVRLDEDGAVTERRLGLGLRGGDLAGQVRQCADDPHPPAATAGRRLHEQREVSLGR